MKVPVAWILKNCELGILKIGGGVGNAIFHLSTLVRDLVLSDFL